VRSIAVVYDDGDFDGSHVAISLRRHAPAGFESRAVVLADDGTVPAEIADGSHDIVLLPSPRHAVAVRHALDTGATGSKLIVQWPEYWPRGIERWHELYSIADGILMSCPTYHARLGQLPRTYVVRRAFDPTLFNNNVVPASTGARVLLLRTGFARRPRTYDLLLNEIAAEQRWPTEVVDTTAADFDHSEWARRTAAATVLLWDPNSSEACQLALEAAACGCLPIAVTQTALPGEARYPGRHVAPDPGAVNDAVDDLLRSPDTHADSLRAELEGWSWVDRAEHYATALHGVSASGGPSVEAMRTPAVDLRDQVTVFVTTVGAPSYPACMTHLDLQDSLFVQREIRHVAPMSAAFQQMVDQCETPYYVQVDEDMLLYPHAVRRLHELIREAGPDAALYAAPLVDPHLDRTIEAVKIFDLKIGQRYPFVDVANCDVERNTRMEDDGYRIAKPPKSASGAYPIESALGVHGPHWTPRSIFERYATLQRIRAETGRIHWIEEYARDFMTRFLDDPSELNFSAMMGVVAGALSAHGDPHREKDFRTYDDYLRRDLLESFYSALKPPDAS
jgi:hypothetical protein